MDQSFLIKELWYFKIVFRCAVCVCWNTFSDSHNLLLNHSCIVQLNRSSIWRLLRKALYCFTHYIIVRMIGWLPTKYPIYSTEIRISLPIRVIRRSLFDRNFTLVSDSGDYRFCSRGLDALSTTFGAALSAVRVLRPLLDDFSRFISCHSDIETASRRLFALHKPLFGRWDGFSTTFYAS